MPRDPWNTLDKLPPIVLIVGIALAVGVYAVSLLIFDQTNERSALITFAVVVLWLAYTSWVYRHSLD